MKKTLKIIAKTTASTLLASMATSCGTEEATPETIHQQKKQKEHSETSAHLEKIKFKINDANGSTAAAVCRQRCVINER